jgi:hypothetical protein
MALARMASQEPLEGDPSLFASDTEILSDSAIRRILDFRVQLGDSNRVAVLQLAERPLFSSRWSRPSAITRESVALLVDSLVGSPRVVSAALLPSLLVPRQRTVGHLREAAARYQADLLVVYRSDCRTYEHTRFLASSDFRAVCVIEAVLIDTRTGIVPFTTTVRHEFTARKTSEDVSVSEAAQRIQYEAIAQALATVGSRTVAFLRGGG